MPPPSDPLPLRPPTPDPAPQPPIDTTETSESTPDSAATEWTVRTGDHLWGIAEATVVGEDTHSLIEHWQRIIELNRHRLPDPGNPDLIFPKMRIQLPPQNPSTPNR